MPAAPAFVAPREAIDAHLTGFVQSLECPDALRDAIAYALLGGGKRLRPLLAWHCCVAAADDPAAGPASLPVAAAVELIHAFSLVHDDLPAMDDDDLRRGRPTLHRHAGEAMAILAGDAMLALAYAALDRPAEGHAPLPGPLLVRVMRELTAGTLGMIAGQVLDTIPGARPEPTPEGVARIHDLKTGALLVASCRLGALVGLGYRAPDRVVRADHPVLAAITDYAASIGRMYQVVDDLLDVTQSADHAGKATGKDAGAGKLTFPAVLGVEGSRATVDELATRAVAASENLGPHGAVLKELVDYFARRTN